MAKETKFIATNVFMKSFRNEDVLYVRREGNNFDWHTIHIYFSVSWQMDLLVPNHFKTKFVRTDIAYIYSELHVVFLFLTQVKKSVMLSKYQKTLNNWSTSTKMEVATSSSTSSLYEQSDLETTARSLLVFEIYEPIINCF